MSDMINLLSGALFVHFGYLFLLILSALESIPFIGLVVPGQTILMLSGFFAHQGGFSIWRIIAVASIGAVFGELISYFVGRAYGYRLLDKYGRYFFIGKDRIEKVRAMTKKHAGKALIFGRFNPLTRAFSSFATGASDVLFMRFFAFSIIGAVVWSTVYVLIGFVFGEGYKVVEKYLGGYFLTLSLIVLSIAYLYYLSYGKKYRFAKENFWTIVSSIVSLTFFINIARGIKRGFFISLFDGLINNSIHNIWNVFLMKIMLFITSFGNTFALIFLSLVLFFMLFYLKRIRIALMFAVNLLVGALFEFFIKNAVHRARPADALISVWGFSFPSGHAIMAVIFFLMLVYSFKDDIRGKFAKYAFIFSCAIIALLVGFSRIYLRVHWFSDVLSGIFLGIFSFCIVLLTFKFVLRSRKEVVVKERFG